MIIEEVVKKDTIDDDCECLCLQNFLDATGALVAAFKELSKDEPDPDLIGAAMQHSLLFLGNASAHLSHLRRTKIPKRLNRDVQGLAKDTDFSETAPFLFGKRIEQKIKERMETVGVLRRMTGKLKPKLFFQWGSSQGSGFGRSSRYQLQTRYHPYSQTQRNLPG